MASKRGRYMRVSPALDAISIADGGATNYLMQFRLSGNSLEAMTIARALVAQDLGKTPSNGLMFDALITHFLQSKLVEA